MTIAFTVLMLAIHPVYQERCYKELQQILPNRNSDITAEQLNQLVYTEQCIKETLRLYPTVSLIGRTSDKAIQLKNITVPAGQSILVAIRQTMRMKEHWGEDADQFNPDHCSAEKLASLPTMAYIPFSEGARSCIGAEMQIDFFSFLLYFNRI